MNKKILSIAIPTYNRDAYLEKQLHRIKQQNNISVDILIADNASSDKTQDIVQQFQKDMPNIFYFRNEANIGFDKNVLKLYSLASTKFIWFLSDDDLIVDNIIDKVLLFVTKYNPTVAVMTATDIDDNNIDLNNESYDVDIYDNLNCVNDYRLFTKTIFISALILRKFKDFDVEEISRLAGTNFIQLSLSLALLSVEFRYCVVSGLIVVSRDPGRITNTEIARLWFVGPAEAMCLNQFGYDNIKACNAISKGLKDFVYLLVAAKLGRYIINPSISHETLRKLKSLFGVKMTGIIFILLAGYRMIPAPVFKLSVWFDCILKNGYINGSKKFRRLTNISLIEKESDF